MLTNDELLKRRATLSPDQLARLRQRIHKASKHQFTTPTIPSRSPDLPIPLSSAQQRLWFLQQLESESTAYNELIALRLYGMLDYAALKQSINRLAQRHEILRTTFPWQDDAIVQHVFHDPQIIIEVPLIDLQNLPRSERLTGATRMVEELQRRPFRLTEEFPWRTCLLRIDAQEHIFCACLHHSITDAWSLEIFVKELMMLYRAPQDDQSTVLPDLPLQYGDYAAWQQQRLASGTFQKHMLYWQHKLRGPLPVLELPTDYPRPPLTSHHGERQYWTIPDTLHRTLAHLCLTEHVTLFTVLMSTFAVLLSRYTMQEDVIIGTPVAGREMPELETLLGCFINTLALRIDLSGHPPFRELLHRVQAETLAASEHQGLPFEKLVELLQPERNMSQNAIFQTMFTFQNVPQTTSILTDLTVTPFEVGVKTAKLDLSLVLRETPDELGGYIEYMTDLFSARSIELLLARYQHLLEGVVAYPDMHMNEISLLLPEEKATILNQHTFPLPTRHFLEAFARQVERVPEALALSDEHEQLSYRVLDARSHHLAATFQQQGIGPETLVGVYTERGVTWATTLLALFKACGVYLPLDPRHPAGRLRSLLTESGCQYLLTTRKLYPGLISLLEQKGLQILCLEDLLTSEIAGTWQEPVYHASNLAYVIYTSGSTGQPKGAMLHHGGMLNHLYAKVAALELDERDIVAQTASQSFDISLWQLLAPWLVGGQTRIYAQEVVANPPQLLRHLEQDAITLLEVVPSWLSTLLEVQAETGRQANLASLRWLIPTGEALTRDLCARWLQSYPHIPLLNAYGPTECSDDVTHHVIHKLSEEQTIGNTIPIGQPLPNLFIYVLDKHMQLLPPGVRGELYVGGTGVGRGYLKDPVRTARIFVPDPWSTVGGERLYRTGDLGCYNQDGQLVFHGRVDQQVKLRGYRIELGEIEQVLRKQPGVKDCVAMVHESGQGGQQLVGYVVEEAGVILAHEEILSAAREELPDYMVPSTLIHLETLPLTPNGKIDRQALTQKAQTSVAHATTDYVAPGTLLEVQVASIWSELISLERPGINDNFFALGGHSLLAVRLIARLEQEFGTRLPLATFFATPTIAALAHAVKNQLRDRQEDALPPLGRATREHAIPLSFTQMRQWLLEQINPEKQLYHMVGVVHLRGKLHLPTLSNGLNEVIRRHEILRTAFVPGITGEPWQVIAPTCILNLREINLQDLPLAKQETAVRELVAEEQKRPFDMTRPPLIRVTAVRLSFNEHILLLTSHQMLFDGWSIEIFLYELGTLYTAFIDHQPSPLPPLPLQYADYAIWQKQMLQGQRLETLFKYWRTQLMDLPALTLPTIHPRPTTPIFDAASIPIMLSQDLSYDLLVLGKREGVTLFMVLLAAFQAILARYSQQTDIVVGSPIAGRSHIQVEPLIGNFLNTLILRTDLSGQPTFRTILQRVRQTVFGAYAHQDLPFEQLLIEQHAERDVALNPLFQVLFAFENHPRQQVSLPGLSARFLEVTSETTTFDLDLTMWEEHGNLVGTCKYNAYLFDPLLVQRLRDDFVSLLTLIASQPDQLIADLPEQGDHQSLLPGASALKQTPQEDTYVAPRNPMEEHLAAIWSDLLSLPQVGIASDFFMLGGHSLLAVRLMARIEQQFGRRLPLATIFQHRTIETLAEMLQRQANASPWSLLLETREPIINLLAEATKEMETFTTVCPTALLTEPATVLLTGATGFLGTFLLGELLEKTTATVFCLVRAASAAEGERHIQRVLQDAQLWQAAYQERIKVIPGDLAKPGLGLNELDYENLTKNVEVIYHNGALVNMLYPYEELKAANVQGTREILRLATTGRIKPVHYISTLSIFPHTGETSIQYVSEDASLDTYHEYVPGGYAQSKWVAEKLVTIARERGLPVVIYRPGRITGHSQTGAWRTNDMLYQMLGGCIQLGMSPILADNETLEMVPVNYVSQAIVALSRLTASQGQAFHLSQPTPTRVNDILEWVKTSGYQLQAVEYQAWLAALAHARSNGQTNILTPSLELLPEPGTATSADIQLPLVIPETRQTLAALAGTGIACAPVDARLLHVYLASMLRSGVLKAQ